MERLESRSTMPLVNHRTPVLTPERAWRVEALLEFDQRIKTLLNVEDNIEYAVEPRIKGLSVELVYEKGTLTGASTRGDGYRGIDITGTIKSILSVPLQLERIHGGLPFPKLLVLWGVVYMETELFLALNRERGRRNLPVFRDPEQAATDSVEQGNLRMTAKRPLDMFCCGASEISGITFETYLETMHALQSWGIRVNRPHLKAFKGIDEAIDQCLTLGKNRAEFPFQVDGAVIKVNSLDLQTRLNVESGNAGWVIEFMFSS